ncbi:uncharacterized protein BYT42DRAFT_589334 [Radiomyces spectabilis]|uniref:uncharacterized protein n=1 Tax=Radiomyces spectabilis TaxID=64574 RepID=UPI00221EAD8A|nr:uncharacterized protein BYT42DRAFT_589334 [Radiomyces spectabilis]KAI8365249.1 hypothetical protein BYT42DRAFT_589334 [Radiomyces spectabilis]
MSSDDDSVSRSSQDDGLTNESTMSRPSSLDSDESFLDDFPIDDDDIIWSDDDSRSDYSIDYEFLGFRYHNYRNESDADSVASELSEAVPSTTDMGFDMWDEDPYSTNDFTWDSNDMRVTGFMKQRQAAIASMNRLACWSASSFWKKEHGWPQQLPSSCSTANHDQCANALCSVISEHGTTEQLYAVYRDRIIKCGEAILSSARAITGPKSGSTENGSASADRPLYDDTTWIESDTDASVAGSPPFDNHSSKTFCETHESVSLSSSPSYSFSIDSSDRPMLPSSPHESCISKFKPYTKFIARSDFPRILPEHAYMPLGFEPLCLAYKYGYMAIGGIEGEFELYCCMNQSEPVKLWGTKFKGRHNVQLMTNSVEIVRWRMGQPTLPMLNDCEPVYQYLLIASMNEAGILVYRLPSHHECAVYSQARRAYPPPRIPLHTHLRSFDRVPINDAKISPDGRTMVCVGDDQFVFLIDINLDSSSQEITFRPPVKLEIPVGLLTPGDSTESAYSSQYVAWSASSRFFAHTSDTHYCVLVWRAETRDVLYSIDAAGYTYAVKFHPYMDGLLSFTNRYGYFHTVNLEEAVDPRVNTKRINMLTFDKQTVDARGHCCDDRCVSTETAAVYHTRHLEARHEITMVAFRGERDIRLRILAKINGIQWSKDGRYLYVATKKRVLAYEFTAFCLSVPSLLTIAGRQMLAVLGQEACVSDASSSATCTPRKRRRIAHRHDPLIEPSPRQRTSRSDQWMNIPAHIRHALLNNSQLASHW